MNNHVMGSLLSPSALKRNPSTVQDLYLQSPISDLKLYIFFFFLNLKPLISHSEHKN